MDISRGTSENELNLDLTHLESIETLVTVSHPKKKTKFDQKFKVQLEEFDEQSMTLELAPGTAERADTINVKIDVLAPLSHKLAFVLQCKVEELTLIHKGPDKVFLLIEKGDIAGWNKFRGYFNSRQDDILRYFEMVKG